jgi:hypothetical protein
VAQAARPIVLETGQLVHDQAQPMRVRHSVTGDSPVPQFASRPSTLVDSMRIGEPVPRVSGESNSVTEMRAFLDAEAAQHPGLAEVFVAPKNYYRIYRSTGGSSLLKISRVVGGVETVSRPRRFPTRPRTPRSICGGAPAGMSCPCRSAPCRPR